MTYQYSERSPLETRLERRANRSATAKRWARRATYGIFGCALTAIWQEPALAPDVYNGMVFVADTAVTWVYDSESSSFSTALYRSGGGATSSQYGLVTETLLKLKN